MPSSSGSAESSNERPRSGDAPESRTGDAQPAPDRAMMEEVLKRTLSESVNSLEPAERDALLAVVRRYRGDVFELDPVAVDLIEVFLKCEFRNPGGFSPEVWRRMCYEIARTLFEDPVARQRLQSIWSALCNTEQ